MPTLFELYGIPELGEAPPKVDTRPDLTRGLKTSFQQLPQLGYGVMAGVGAAAESLVGEGGIASGVKKAGVEGYQRWEDTIQQNSKESDSLSYSWDQAKQGNFGALVDWFQYGLGYAGGQAVQMLATAGLGSMAAKWTAATVAKEVAKGMVLKEAGAIAATEEGKALAKDALIALATKNVASKVANIGATAATGAAAFGMEGGEIFGDLVAGAEKEGRQLTGDELAKAFGATLAAGGLEFVGDKFGLDVMLGRSKLGKTAMGAAAEAPGIGGRVARGALGAAITAPVEGGTEYLQTGLEEFGKGKEANILPWNQSEDAQKQAFDAAGLGAVGGAAFGGGAGIITRARAKQQQDDDAIVKITEAKTVDEAAAAAVAAVSTPLDVGLTVEQEARGLDSLDAQRQRDEASVKDWTNRPSDYLGPVPERPNRQPSITEGEPSPFLDRLLTLREQLDDPRTREQLREALGDEAFGTVAYYASIADRTGDEAPPFKTREKLLDLAETIVQRAVFRPIESRGLVGEPLRRPALSVAQGPPLIELDTTPTGRVRVDAQGNAAPETRADVIDLKQRVQQMRERSDGLTAQVDRQPLPRDFSLVGEGELTTPERRQPVERETLLLTQDHFPYGTRSGAVIRARREGLDADAVVQVEGGFAVRTQETPSEPVSDMDAAAGGTPALGAERPLPVVGSGADVGRVATDASGREQAAATSPVAGGRPTDAVELAGASNAPLTEPLQQRMADQERRAGGDPVVWAGLAAREAGQPRKPPPELSKASVPRWLSGWDSAVAPEDAAQRWEQMSNRQRIAVVAKAGQVVLPTVRWNEIAEAQRNAIAAAMQEQQTAPAAAESQSATQPTEGARDGQVLQGQGRQTQEVVAQPTSEQRPAPPEAESQAPATSEPGDAGVAPGQESGAPSLKERVEATKPPRETIELRKREAVLARLLECMSNG